MPFERLSFVVIGGLTKATSLNVQEQGDRVIDIFKFGENQPSVWDCSPTQLWKIDPAASFFFPIPGLYVTTPTPSPTIPPSPPIVRPPSVTQRVLEVAGCTFCVCKMRFFPRPLFFLTDRNAISEALRSFHSSLVCKTFLSSFLFFSGWVVVASGVCGPTLGEA